MQSTQEITFKLFFGAENIRRLTIVPSTLEKFQELLNSLYPGFYHPELTFTYTDVDGDAISVTTELEWQELLHLSASSRMVKLNVVAKNPNSFFRDGPAPEVVGIFKDGVRVEANEVEETLASRTTKALESLFPNQKILPYNVPSFLSGVVEFSTNPDNTVDFKTDINNFFSALTAEACRLMETPQIKGALDSAKSLLMSQSILEPGRPVTLYNLACVEALTGNVSEAFHWLEQAVSNGYENIAHMVQDEDLMSLRGLPEWDQLVTKLKQVSPFEEENQEIETPVPAATVEQPQVVPVQAEAAPVASVDTEKWQSQLQVLHDMGFLSDSVLVPYLEKHGSVEGALADLLG